MRVDPTGRDGEAAEIVNSWIGGALADRFDFGDHPVFDDDLLVFEDRSFAIVLRSDDARGQIRDASAEQIAVTMRNAKAFDI